MERLVSLLEGIVSDIVFSGADEIHSDVLERIRSAAKLCKELDMETGESLCKKIEEYAADDNSENIAEIICTLCFYTECISNQLSV